MGADGHMIVVKRSAWDDANPGVEPSELGLYTGVVLGVEAAWGYAGDNMLAWKNYGDEFYLTYDESRPNHEATAKTVKLRRAALAWFDANAEWHEVWT